jgi:hypothetical protein
MTVSPKSLDHRYHIYVDLTDGAQGILVNSYKTEDGAKKCVQVLNADVPASYVDKAWYVDTDGIDRLVTGE